MTTLFVDSTGGRLRQLDTLAGRIPADGPAGIALTALPAGRRPLLAGRAVEPGEVGDDE
jgi:hypothetical protein